MMKNVDDENDLNRNRIQVFRMNKRALINYTTRAIESVIILIKSL